MYPLLPRVKPIRVTVGNLPACAALCLAWALSTALAAGPTGGGTFVTASHSDCTAFNPYLTADVNSWRISSSLFDTLLSYDDALAPRPCLAESWTLSPDGKIWSFRLRKNVRFHDGKELTASDVQFTLDMLRDPKNRVTRRTCVDAMQPSAESRDRVRFDASGPHAFSVHFEKPAAWAIDDWASLPILPRHRLEGRDLAQDPFNTSAPIGTGPFRLTRAIPGEQIELEAFDDHFAGRPRFDRLIVRIVPDDRKRLELLRAGMFDHAQVPTRQLLVALDDGLKDAFRVYALTEPSYAYVGWQCDPQRSPLFADSRIRQAMTWAIDVDALIRDTLAGQAVRTTSVFERAGGAQAAQPAAPAYDPDRARKALGSAGWFDTDADGVLDRGGQRFSFHLDAPAGSETVRQQVEQIVSDLAKLGVEARPRFTDWELFMTGRIQPRDFEAVYLGWYLPIEPDPHPFFHSSSIPTPADPRGLNRNGFRDADVDRLIDEARAAVDPALRRALIDEIDRKLRELAPYTLLFQARQFGLISRRVQIERASVVPAMNPALRTTVLEVSRLGLLTPDFLRRSWLTPAAPRPGQ